MTHEAIYSSYKDHPVYQELLQEFVNCLDQRLETAQMAFASQDWPELKRTMHQLRGAAATYGYPVLAEQAGGIETKVLAGEASSETLRPAMDTVEQICRRIELGMRA